MINYVRIYVCMCKFMSVFTTQDKVWGYALLISGLFCVFMVYRVGRDRYRREIVNKVSIYYCGVVLYCKTH